jgi:hypothetical protein
MIRAISTQSYSTLKSQKKKLFHAENDCLERVKAAATYHKIGLNYSQKTHLVQFPFLFCCSENTEHTLF